MGRYDQDMNPGEWIDHQCRELGISVSQLAREARIDRGTFGRWKRGEVSPNLDTIQRCEKTFEAIFWQRYGSAGGDGAA